MCKLSQPRANTDISWGRGLWLGRSTLNNEILVRTTTGEVITVRTIRRLPPEEQQDQGLLAALKGTPWSPKGTAEVEPTLPELALEQFRFAAGRGGPKRRLEHQPLRDNRNRKMRPPLVKGVQPPQAQARDQTLKDNNNNHN